MGPQLAWVTAQTMVPTGGHGVLYFRPYMNLHDSSIPFNLHHDALHCLSN